MVVTGATGTVGQAAVDLLAADAAVGSVATLGRNPPASTARSSKVTFRPGDVRDATRVRRVVAGADVVVHLAYALHGVGLGERDLFDTNVEGTLNVARAAVEAGARRFVYTSSAAVYGFHPDNPDPIDENTPIRASARHFYGRHKAQAELLVRDATRNFKTETYVFRPCAIVGPHGAGAILHGVPGPLVDGARAVLGAATRAGFAPPLPAPPVPLQFVHEEDVAAAVGHAVRGDGPPGVYNLAAEDAIAGDEVLRLLGLRPLPIPGAAARAALRLFGSVPPLLPALAWTEALAHPLMLDASKARRELGWQPRHSSRAALRATRQGLGT